MKEQMLRCRTETDGRIYVPARVNDEAVQLIFSNSPRFDCFLYQSYATEKGLAVTNAQAQLDSLTAFGQTKAPASASVQGTYRGGEPPIAGFLNSQFLKPGIVAIDASVPVMAFTLTREHLTLTNPVGRLPLNGDAVAIPSGSFAVAYQMGSVVAQRFLGQQRPRKNGRAEVTLSLTDGITVTQSVGVRAESTFDGILGADLLCRWVTVFDFAAGELLLFSYD